MPVDERPIEVRRRRPMTSVRPAMSDLPLDTHPTPAVSPVPAALAAARERRAAERDEVAREQGAAPPPLVADARTLRFGHDGDGRLRIDVYDGAGKLVRSIPPNSAMAKAMGAMTWQG